MIDLQFEERLLKQLWTKGLCEEEKTGFFRRVETDKQSVEHTRSLTKPSDHGSY